jgi:EmrB/QacA subfamily drug resistance transporter
MSSAPSRLHAKKWWALGVLSMAQLMVALDATVINIALPKAQVALHFTNANRQWLISAYALAFGSLMLLGGRFTDLWGRRNTLHVGLVGFALASALGGAANSFHQLVLARAVQGVFGALLAPAALAAVSVTFTDPKERAKAFSIYGALGGSGAAIGLLLGGALTQWASWRWCLYINLVVAAVAVIGVALFVENDHTARRTHLDALGVLLGSGGIYLVVYGFSHAVETSWSTPLTWESLGGGGVVLGLFLLWQRRAPYPLLPLRLITQRTRAGSLIGLFVTSVGMFGISLFLAYYLENSLGYSPLRAGVDFLPLVVALALTATVASARLLAKVGPRPLVPIGMVLAMMGMILFTRITVSSTYLGGVFPGLVLTGLGLGLIFAPAVASATSGIDAADAGAASALVNTTQQIGGSVGTALLNTIAVSVSVHFVAAYAKAHVAHLTNAEIAKSFARGTLHGYSVAYWWAAGLFGLGAIASFALLESGVPELEGDLVPLL